MVLGALLEHQLLPLSPKELTEDIGVSVALIALPIVWRIEKHRLAAERRHVEAMEQAERHHQENLAAHAATHAATGAEVPS